jgi:hypothetical protein
LVNPNFTIIVNSSDGFSDCWEPFFKLFKLYWPECDAAILLNTEKKDWSYPGLDVRCTQVSPREETRRPTWSECLLRALEQVKTPLVLYFQEDYFFERPVNHALINDLARTMVERPEIKHLGLTHFGSRGPFAPTADPRLWSISQKAGYRISTQAGLWRVDTLRSYLRPEENGWMFELYGTQRARRKVESFLTVNRDTFDGDRAAVIKYTHTGIIKGKWHPAMPALFAAHGIPMDFTRRGFYRAKHPYVEKLHTLKKLLGDPSGLLRGLSGSG